MDAREADTLNETLCAVEALCEVTGFEIEGAGCDTQGDLCGHWLCNAVGCISNKVLTAKAALEPFPYLIDHEGRERGAVAKSA
jgi:hypothetical protein